MTTQQTFVHDVCKDTIDKLYVPFGSEENINGRKVVVIPLDECGRNTITLFGEKEFNNEQ